jgi:probable phosphoglycerate mutase
MQLIVIRHASTAYNEKELINGQRDEGLSPKGLAQIDGLIESVAQYKFSVIYASDLKRSIQTATPIAKHYNVPLKKDSRIKEVGLGSFEGKGWESTVADFGVNSSGLLSSCAYDFTAYGGESATETRARVQSFIDDLKKDSHATPLVVTHGGIMRWFYYLCTGEKIGRVPNSSVHILEL